MASGLPLYGFAIFLLLVGQSMAESSDGFKSQGSKTVFNAKDTSAYGTLLTKNTSLTGTFKAINVHLPDPTLIALTLNFDGCEIEEKLEFHNSMFQLVDADAQKSLTFDLKLDVAADKVTFIDKNNQSLTKACTVVFNETVEDTNSTLDVEVELEKPIPGLIFEFDAPLYEPPPPINTTEAPPEKGEAKSGKMGVWGILGCIAGGLAGASSLSGSIAGGVYLGVKRFKKRKHKANERVKYDPNSLISKGKNKGFFKRKRRSSQDAQEETPKSPKETPQKKDKKSPKPASDDPASKPATPANKAAASPAPAAQAAQPAPAVQPQAAAGNVPANVQPGGGPPANGPAANPPNQPAAEPNLQARAPELAAIAPGPEQEVPARRAESIIYEPVANNLADPPPPPGVGEGVNRQ
ncbi:hypothetical protein M3Y96_01215800 [Aphelenchoides besseyi]|nr:hypothetical protein M3Y96_01215800 [Aphelenchoides besseyi]